NADEPSIANQPVPTSVTGTSTTPGTTTPASTPTQGVAATTANAAGAAAGTPGNPANSPVVAAVPGIQQPEVVSRQTVRTPAHGAGAQSDPQPPTSWQQPPPRPVKPSQRVAAADVNPDGSVASTKPAPVSTSDPPRAGAQVGPGGSGRGGASKDPAAT